MGLPANGLGGVAAPVQTERSQQFTKISENYKLDKYNVANDDRSAKSKIIDSKTNKKQRRKKVLTKQSNIVTNYFKKIIKTDKVLESFDMNKSDTIKEESDTKKTRKVNLVNSPVSENLNPAFTPTKVTKSKRGTSNLNSSKKNESKKKNGERGQTKVKALVQIFNDNCDGSSTSVSSRNSSSPLNRAQLNANHAKGKTGVKADGFIGQQWKFVANRKVAGGKWEKARSDKPNVEQLVEKQ